VDIAMSHPVIFPIFYDWSVANLCSENLAFYQDVEKFRKMDDEAAIQKEANRIYLKYIKDNSYSQINLDADTKKEITGAVTNKVSQIMFDSARIMVLELIKYDLLVKFLDSDEYRAWKGLPCQKKLRSLPRKNIGKRVAEMPNISTASITKLENCLLDPVAIDEFRQFTKEEFSDALLAFYLEVQKFHESPSVQYANQIYARYLSHESDEEVDTDPKIKKHILQIIATGTVTPDLFDKLQTQVFSVMAQDNFFRFQLRMISRLAIN
jgi:hypothetical protein